ncbi:hypothetical protein [Streptomyces altiplanensis]
MEAELAALPTTIAQELSVWIKAVRGEDKWEHTGRTYRSIARYWHVLDPILKRWLADGIERLRQGPKNQETPKAHEPPAQQAPRPEAE